MRGHYSYDKGMREVKERGTVQYQLDRIKGIAEDTLSLHRFGYNWVSPYIGHIIGLGGSQMDLGKVKIIQDWPKPKKVKDIQSFLGFSNFYRHNYSNIVVLLTCLTWKATPWDFSDKCCLSFSLLKNTFMMAPVLTHWRPDLPIIVETDTSDYALGAIL